MAIAVEANQYQQNRVNGTPPLAELEQDKKLWRQAIARLNRISNMGTSSNRITTDELTHMVRQIYQFHRSEDVPLLVALAGQSNPEFGQRAIAQLNHPRVDWIGEKWGRSFSS